MTVGALAGVRGEVPARAAATPTSARTARKIRILSISTSGITYDFEQAKKPGFTGWATQSITNSLLSDLLPGFNLSLTHDLWRGQPSAVDTAEVRSLPAERERELRDLGQHLPRDRLDLRAGRKVAEAERARPEEVPTSYVAESGRRRGRARSSAPPRCRSGARAGRFTANFNYQLTRTRPRSACPTRGRRRDRQSLGFSTNFSPTPFWSLSWSSQYNITDGQFESQVVRLERELHEWRAGFNFVKNPNGNFAFYFSIYLTDLPELKFDYDQTTIER